METPKKPLFRGINRKLMVAFFAIALLAALMGVFNLIQLRAVTSPLQEIPPQIGQLSSSSHLNSLAQAIRYYDEVLTQSARNYAFTGDVKWKDRYLAAEPELDKSIKAAIAEGDDTDREFFSSVDQSNLALVDMEHKSMELTDQGNASAAIAILESREYADQKAIYANGLNGYLDRVGGNYENALAGLIDQVDGTVLNVATEADTQQRVITFSVAAMIAAATIFAYYIREKIYRPIKDLESMVRKMEAGDYSARVNIRTGDELEDLGSALNSASEALQKLDGERTQVDRAKTQFLSITSHELRSPMTPMKAQLQMLEQGYLGRLTPKQKESLQIVIRNADRLDKILVDFLEISRIEAARLKFDFKKTDIKKVTGEVIEYMEGYIPEKKIRIRAKLSPLPTIEADPDRISQVLRNLIGNAIKFSPEGSTIEVGAKRQGAFIEFYVKDSGIGISPENQIRLFEPFYQVDKTFAREQQGTGLGLAICRGIVESQGGKIWLESDIGKGATFHFTIPLEPVREIKPIKVLFSAKDDAERLLREAFKEFLGPLGENEFEALRKKSGVSRKGLLLYMDGISKEGIITKEDCERFKSAIPENIA
jgi:signal transduction histidine kinase